jgi:hypothetical protein
VGGGLPSFAGLFGVDVFDLAAAGLLPMGPPSAALPGCGVQFVTCVPYSGGPLGFDLTGTHDLGGNGLDCAVGEGCETAGITQVTLDAGRSAGSGGTAGCQAKILGAVNQTFRTNFTSFSSSFFNPPQGRPGSALNLVISATNLPASQFNAIQPGRYPLNWFSYLVGYGPTLHVAGPGPLNPNARFSSSNIGGVTSVTFTAHLDSAYAYNPVGLVLHGVTDVLGVHRNPCP